MPIPETPYTRKEAYLNAAATGDSNGIPETPYTREEMYLDAIARNGSGGGGSSTLAGLTDVDLTNPTDGQTLVYDAASSKWVNGSGGGSSGVTIIEGVYSGETQRIECSITAAELMTVAKQGVVMIRDYDESGEELLTVIYAGVWSGDYTFVLFANSDTCYKTSNLTANSPVVFFPYGF